MTKGLSVREILAQLLGGVGLLDKGETGFKLVKSSEGLEKLISIRKFLSRMSLVILHLQLVFCN